MCLVKGATENNMWFYRIPTELDFYSQVRLVNFIRRQVRDVDLHNDMKWLRCKEREMNDLHNNGFMVLYKES